MGNEVGSSLDNVAVLKCLTRVWFSRRFERKRHDSSASLK